MKKKIDEHEKLLLNISDFKNGRVTNNNKRKAFKIVRNNFSN